MPDTYEECKNVERVSDSSGSTIRKLYKGLNNLTSAYVFTVVQLQISGSSPSTGFIQRKGERKARIAFAGREQGTDRAATPQCPFQS